MKRALAMCLALCFAFAAVSETVFLVDRYKSVDDYQFARYTKKRLMPLSCGFEVGEGFALQSTYEPYEKGFVVYVVDGRYSRLSFLVAHMRQGSYGAHRERGRVAVVADGKQIFSKSIAPYDVPHRYTIDITGVDTLRFEIERGDINVGFGEVMLSDSQDMVQGSAVRSSAKRTVLVRNTSSYFYNKAVVKPIVTDNESASHVLKINGVAYQSGLEFEPDIDAPYSSPGWAYFYLGGKYSSVRFVVGPRDVDSGHNGSSLFSVNADNKELFRKTVGETDVAEAVILDVEGRQWIAFESGQTTGNMHLCVGNIVAYPKGVVPEGVRAGKNRRGGGRLAGLPDMCRLVSAVPPISLKGNMARKEALFDGSDEKRTLDMGGYSFTEGFILSNDNGGGAAADFDVDNQFDFVTFTTGWIDQCHVLKTDTLQVFADDSLVYSTPLLASRGNVPHKVDIDRCHRLSFRKKGIDADRQPVFAVADVVAYRGEVIDNTLFAHPKPELPPETDIYAIGKPFLYYVNDSMPMVDNGFALQSHISESGERMPSCAAFNTYGAYSTLTFTVACAKKGNTDERIVLEEFSIGADHNQASSIILYENMEPTTYSVNIANCSQLLFWLDCGAQPSSQYVFYNIGLSNDPVAPHRSPFE